MKKYIYEIDLIFSNHKVLVADGECLVCKHCTDVFLDATHGPYMTVCEYTRKDEELGDEVDLSSYKKYGEPCDKYEYDGEDREFKEL